jgi:hypothetical protein
MTTSPQSRRTQARLAMSAGTIVAVMFVAACAGPAPTPFPPASSEHHTGTATAVPSVAASPQVLPSIGVAPAGPWTGIRWINAGRAFPQLAAKGSDLAVYPRVYGWSRGFVGFTSASTTQAGPAASTAVVGVASTDGLHWTSGAPLDVSGANGAINPTAVVEGPSGLLAVGRGPVAICGGPPTVKALWTSTDGLTWSRVKLPADFEAASVLTVEGGSNSFVAAGVLADGVTQSIWLSPDGRSWRQAPLRASAFGRFDIAGAVNFNGGYVVSGAVNTDTGCGEMMATSLWWSTDGASWVRSALPGAISATSDWMTVIRISDHSLMALSTEWDETTLVRTQHIWVSSDGRTWQAVVAPSKMLTSNVLTDHRRGLSIVEPVALDPTVTKGPLTVATIGDDLTPSILEQTGDGPAMSPALSGWSAAFGPTGILVLSLEGTSLWLGVPTAD